MAFFRDWKKVPNPLRLRQRVRRRDRWFYIAAVLLVAALYVFRVPSGKISPQKLARSSSGVSLITTPRGIFCVAPEALKSVPVLNVADGDTLQISWEGRPIWLRYYGVDTPEREQPCYAEASRRNGDLAGKTVKLAFDERTQDPNGRLLAYVFTEEGRSIDATLIQEGLGLAWKRDGSLRRQLMDLEEETRRQAKGCLWESESRRDAL